MSEEEYFWYGEFPPLLDFPRPAPGVVDAPAPSNAGGGSTVVEALAALDSLCEQIQALECENRQLAEELDRTRTSRDSLQAQLSYQNRHGW